MTYRQTKVLLRLRVRSRSRSLSLTTTKTLHGSKEQPNVQYIVYSKNLDKTPDDAISLPNVGREAHTFLYHIVEKYNYLADWNVFTEGGTPGQDLVSVHSMMRADI
mmetsp:Transcript_21547/g.36716  ORF Transcript_21547/g.36716 Transcript_21547/m.36716 type:complete len:106 (+) Transcript_21547:177-494(+)